MLYAIAHFVRDKIPWLWDLVDIINSFLFFLRYEKKLRTFEVQLDRTRMKFGTYGLTVLPIYKVPTDKLVGFFARQPQDAFMFFKPHGFDSKDIKKLQRNNAFLAYVLVDDFNEQIAGYCFIRSFFHGKGFRGRMVDINYRGKGLGTTMNKILNEVGFGIGLRLFETVNKDNEASYRSAISASNVKVIAEMEHKDLFLEILKD